MFHHSTCEAHGSGAVALENSIRTTFMGLCTALNEDTPFVFCYSNHISNFHCQDLVLGRHLDRTQAVLSASKEVCLQPEQPTTKSHH